MFRVKLLSAGRLMALALFVAIAVALAVYLVMRHKRNEPKTDRPILQGKIVAVFNNTHYAHEVEGKVRFVLTAGTDKTYENGGHELEQVQLESYGADGNRHDVVTSERANVSDTSDLNKLIGEFIANVVVKTSDGLTVKTDYMRYDSVKNTVETDKPVAFEGRNYSGTCTGALIEATEERAHLLADVDFTIKPGDEKQDKAADKNPATAGPREETAAERDARRARKRARKLARKQAAALAQAKGETGGGLAAPSGKANDRSGAPQVQSKEPTRVRCGSADVKMHAPPPANAQQNPTERQLSANHVTLEFHPDGKNLRAAEALENAVMTVTPVRAIKGADKKTIHAPQMIAVLYEQDNRIKTYTATGGVRADIEATAKDAHPPRVTTSKSLKADFVVDSQDIDQAVQEGDFKYNEGDRHGVAERAVYDGQKEVLNLRGKRPQAWDAKARTQADEIDYDRQKDETHARGDVRTTYYSRETTNNATPFKNTKSPIFMTAERADARNGDGVAIYTGKARGWHDDNFVKGDRIELYQDDQRMVADGHVESALYQAPHETAPGKRETVPGFATAERMTYSDTERLVHYEGNVHARQGTDRIEAAKVDVFLQKETNEVDRMLADGNVVLTQPQRRGTGDHLVYTASDGRAVLTGKSARVDDAEQGSTMGTELTFYSRDDRIQVENKQGTGRVRSTHRLTKSKEN